MFRTLRSEFVDPRSISTVLAGCLIALGKNLGVRPIGIGEIPHYIIMARTVN